MSLAQQLLAAFQRRIAQPAFRFLGKETRFNELARIVAITNVFDNRVAEGSGTSVVRQKAAYQQVAGPLAPQFDRLKLAKALRIMAASQPGESGITESKRGFE